jgi:Cysteine rich repeat
MIRKLVLVAVLSAASSTVFAQGTAEEEAACRPDVRRFCHAIPEGGNFLKCLQEHREKLRRPCRAMLEGHGL